LVENENCLYVNVQRPIGTRSDQELPVYVYIHGGGFQGGKGENLNKVVAETGVIGVSLNYRLGVLGFLSLPALTAKQGESGNYGFEDQQAALRWVQRNISRFGGDPRRVTIGGESAGGWSVCYHLVAPGSRGLFSQAMIQSGSCPSQTQAQAEASGTSLATQLGCANATTAAACMRSKPVGQLLASHGVPARVVSGTSVLPANPQMAIDTGQFARVPMVVGGQRDEGRSFSQGAIGWIQAQSVAWVHTTYGSDADAVLAHYPWPASSDNVTAAYLVAAIRTDSGQAPGGPGTNVGTINGSIGGCGTRQLTLTISRYTRTYSYEFDHRSGPGWTGVPGFVWGAGHDRDQLPIPRARHHHRIRARQLRSRGE
jgi:para-nitrobenzyl esterase